MKIVQTNKAYYPKVGGIETTITTLSEGLVNKYISDVEVLVCNHKRTYRDIKKNIKGVLVHYLPTYGFFSSLPISPAYPTSLLKMSGDILHIHQPFPLADLTLEIFPKLRKKFSKIVASWHCDITRQKWALPIYGKYIHKFLSIVDKIIVSNPYLIENSEFLPDYKNKCEVIPIGINLEWAKLNPKGNEHFNYIKNETNNPVILFVGRLVVYKGIEYLIKAMQDVKDSFLIIIGSGPLEKSLRELIDGLKLNSRIKIIQEVDEITLQEYYKNCDLFVLPSINKTEAYGIVQIEAMACGKPVVCTELGTGTTYLNIHNYTGLVVPPSDSKSLAVAINKILLDSGLRTSLGVNGKERALSEFTSDKMIKSTYELYDKILSK